MNRVFMLRNKVERMENEGSLEVVNRRRIYTDGYKNYSISGSVVDEYDSYTGELMMNVKFYTTNPYEEYVASFSDYTEDYTEEQIQDMIDDDCLYEAFIKMLCSDGTYEGEYEEITRPFYYNGIRHYGALHYVESEFEETVKEYGVDDKNGEYTEYRKYLLTSDSEGRSILYTVDFEFVYVKQYYYEVVKVSNGGTTRYVNIYNDEKYNEEVSRINDTKLSESKNEKLNGTLIIHGNGLDVVSYELMTYYKNIYPELSLIDVQELYTLIKEEE